MVLVAAGKLAATAQGLVLTGFNEAKRRDAMLVRKDSTVGQAAFAAARVLLKNAGVAVESRR